MVDEYWDAQNSNLPTVQNCVYYVTPKQVEALLTAAKDDDQPYLYSFIFIGRETAMRKM